LFIVERSGHDGVGTIGVFDNGDCGGIRASGIESLKGVAVQPVEVPAYNAQGSGNGEKQGDAKGGKTPEKETESTKRRGGGEHPRRYTPYKVTRTTPRHPSQNPANNECMITPTSIKVQRWHVKIRILRFGLIQLVLIFAGLQRWHVKMAFPKGR
jgi:hypothetical protein